MVLDLCRLVSHGCVRATTQERRRRRDETAGADPERVLSGPEREYIKETYDVTLGTFNDYAEMIIQVEPGAFSRT